MDDIEYDAYQITLAEEPDTAPEQPEPLALLRKLRRFDTTYYAGGYQSQPHLLMREFNVVIEAEIEHQEAVAANLRLRAQQLEAAANAQPA